MPRDPHQGLYAVVEVDFPTSYVMAQLPLGARWLYHVIWCYALKQKREKIQRPSDNYFATIAALPRHPIATYLARLRDSQLLSFDACTIEVIGLKKKHPKIKFKDDLENSHDDLKNSHGPSEQNRTEQNRTEPPSPLKGEASAPKIPPCPYNEIITSYQTHCDSLKPFDYKDITEGLKTTLRRIWKDHPDLIWWINYFKRCNESRFLSGRVKDFQASLPWIIGPKNMTKVLGGQYDNKQGSIIPNDPNEGGM